MIIKITEKEENEYGEGCFYSVETPKAGVSFGDMAPEDATLNRDLNCVYNIPNMLLEAYNAGKNDEELIFEHIKGE